MKSFVRRFAAKILGVLSGFDRIRLRGTLPCLASAGSLLRWLESPRILLKDFPKYANDRTAQLRETLEAKAAEAGKLNTPHGFDMKYFPVNTSYETIFQAHRQRVSDFLNANPDLYATEMQTLDEVLEMQNRMQAAKAAYRQGIGNITVDELKRLGATSHTAMKIKQSMNRSENER